MGSRPNEEDASVGTEYAAAVIARYQSNINEDLAAAKQRVEDLEADLEAANQHVEDIRRHSVTVTNCGQVVAICQEYHHRAPISCVAKKLLSTFAFSQLLDMVICFSKETPFELSNSNDKRKVMPVNALVVALIYHAERIVMKEGTLDMPKRVFDAKPENRVKALQAVLQIIDDANAKGLHASVSYKLFDLIRVMLPAEAKMFDASFEEVSVSLLKNTSSHIAPGALHVLHALIAAVCKVQIALSAGTLDMEKRIFEATQTDRADALWGVLDALKDMHRSQMPARFMNIVFDILVMLLPSASGGTPKSVRDKKMYANQFAEIYRSMEKTSDTLECIGHLVLAVVQGDDNALAKKRLHEMVDETMQEFRKRSKVN